MTNGVAIDSSGRLLVAAKVGMAHGSRFGLARLLKDGSADLGFGNQGSVIGQFEPGFDAMAGKVQVLADGRLLVVGLHYENAHRSLPAWRMFDPQGHPVQEFGDNGHCVVDCRAICPMACAMPGLRRAYRVQKPAMSMSRRMAGSCWWPITISSWPTTPAC